MRNQESIFRKSPFVLIKSVVIFNVVLAVLLALASVWIDIRTLSNNVSASEVISFDLSAIAIFCTFEIVTVVMSLMNWLKDFYKLTSTFAVHESSKKVSEKMYLNKIIKISYSTKFLSKYVNYGDVTIYDDKKHSFIFKDVSDPLYLFSYLETLRVNRDIPSIENISDLEKVLNNGENQLIEFKSSSLWDVRKKNGSREVQMSVVKTIAGFLNSYGGVLIIGVNDEKKVLGLENDFKLLKKKNIDGFEAHLTQMIKDSIGIEFKNWIDIKFLNIDGKDICILNIRQIDTPIYVKNGSIEDFYIRAGNSTHSLSISSAMRYISDHFKSEV